MWFSTKLQKLFFVFCYLTTAYGIKQNDIVNRLLLSTSQCPINACEMIKLFSDNIIKCSGTSNESNRLSEYLYLLLCNRTISNFNVLDHHCDLNLDSKTDLMKNKESSQAFDELKRNMKKLERRLSSVEQPIWKISKGELNEWIVCGQGNRCRCLAGTKSLNCWNYRLENVPVMQTIPKDIVNMYALVLEHKCECSINKFYFFTLMSAIYHRII